MNRPPQQRTSSLQMTAVFWSAVCHLSGFLTVLGILSFTFMNQAAISALQSMVQTGGMASNIGYEVLLTVGIAACIWAMIYIAVLVVSAQIKASRTTRMLRSRGTILTETLIIMPVFLLFTFGLAQLTLNNMAGLLTTLATYEAGRTLAVWVPEADTGRNGATKAIAIDKATAAAAGVLAPVVAPRLASCSPNSPTLTKQLKGLQSAGNLDLGGLGAKAPTSFASALDNSTIPLRGIMKTRIAYCSTTVNYKEDGSNTISTSVLYKHKAAMPLVKILFGVSDTVAGSSGYYSPIVRSYVTTKQIKPNVVDPY